MDFGKPGTGWWEWFWATGLDGVVGTLAAALIAVGVFWLTARHERRLAWQQGVDGAVADLSMGLMRVQNGRTELADEVFALAWGATARVRRFDQKAADDWTKSMQKLAAAQRDHWYATEHGGEGDVGAAEFKLAAECDSFRNQLLEWQERV